MKGQYIYIYWKVGITLHKLARPTRLSDRPLRADYDPDLGYLVGTRDPWRLPSRCGGQGAQPSCEHGQYRIPAVVRSSPWHTADAVGSGHGLGRYMIYGIGNPHLNNALSLLLLQPPSLSSPCLRQETTIAQSAQGAEVSTTPIRAGWSLIHDTTKVFVVDPRVRNGLSVNDLSDFMGLIGSSRWRRRRKRNLVDSHVFMGSLDVMHGNASLTGATHGVSPPPPLSSQSHRTKVSKTVID